jgi:hypothetical protein
MGTIRLAEASEVLGCSLSEFRRLEDHGIVRAAINAGRGAESGRNRYSKRDIEALKESIMAAADGNPIGMISLRKACRRTRLSLPHVVDLLLKGELGAAYVAAGGLFDSLLIDLADLRANDRDESLLNAREVCERLRLPRKAQGRLIEAGLLNMAATSAPARGNDPILIGKADTEKFDRGYVSIKKLAEERGASITEVNAALKAAGVQQFMTRATDSVVLYERSAVSVALDQLH